MSKRTNVVLDDKLLKEAKERTGVKTTRAVVDLALRQLVRQARQKDILDLFGKIHWQGDLDQMRRGRTFR